MTSSGGGPGMDSSVGRRSVLKALGGAGTASLTGIAGCATQSSGNDSELTSRTGTRSRKRVSLEYVDVAGERTREQFAPAVKALEDEYNVEIDLTFTEIPYEQMKSTLLTRVGGGNAPDIAAIDQIWLGSFIESGNLMTLDGVAEDVDFDDYLDEFANVARQNGHVYGFPIGTDVRGMYWNKPMFEDAGLDPEEPPRTWSELIDIATRLHDPPETYGTTYFVNTGRWTVNLFAAGGRVLNEDETEPLFHERPGIRAAEFVDRVYNGADISPPEPIFRNGSQMAREFLEGHYAINLVEGSWLDYFWRSLGNETPDMLERFGFAPTPHPEGGAPATMSGGFVWAAFDTTDHPRIVREFIRTINRREFIERLMIETKDIPTRKSLLDAEGIWEQVSYGNVIKEMIQDTNLRPVKNWSVVAETLDPALQRIAFDRRAPRDSLEEAARTVSTELG